MRRIQSCVTTARWLMVKLLAAIMSSADNPNGKSIYNIIEISVLNSATHHAKVQVF